MTIEIYSSCDAGATWQFEGSYDKHSEATATIQSLYANHYTVKTKRKWTFEDRTFNYSPAVI
jgi:hypothetical protein